eukprot:CAMPEP_0185799958 /NCGR_PEP_ID=MMETSP1322-20130828/614_1 /TAXON_ID=265543 /ORGANISM="Minutocellus polymorphus, Strain RCC2270" /LENGTH=617 /DNA_ID=CAMNT_0028495567 /DNA_START=37 /DNA_END=1887 /DNA_ORIENTATION=-
MRALQQVFRRRSSSPMGGSTGSAGTNTTHLLALPSSDSIGLPPPAPPAPPAAGATPSPRLYSRYRKSSCIPPRPSPDSSVLTRKSYGTCSSPISQSDATQVATNGTLSRIQFGAADYNRAVKAAAYALKGTEDATLSDGDESDTISDLTALSAAYNSGALTEEGSGDQNSSAEKTKTSAPKKPKSIFRRSLKYTKPPFGFGRNNGGVNSISKSKDSTHPLPQQKIKTDINALLNPSTEPNDLSSPKTPKTAMTEDASLDYSTDENDSKVAGSRRTKSKKKTTNNEWNRVEVHTPPLTNNIVHPLSSAQHSQCMSSPSLTTMPSRPSSDSSTSLSSHSGDTFSTLTTKSSTNGSIKTAPSKVCTEKGTKSDEQANCHRRVKSQEEMDDLFATILSITDVPGQDIEDMLNTNKSVQSQAKRSRRKKQVSSINAITNINFVEHEERARARESGGLLVPRFESYARAEEKIGQSDHNITTPQLPMAPRSWHHRRLPSREEHILAAPRMPIFPRDDQQGRHKKSIDSIEIGRQSPHVQFREERLCSFDSFVGGNVKGDDKKEKEILGGGDTYPTDQHKVYGYEHEEELLESEISQTLLSMEAFHVKVEELDDLSDDLDNERW